MAFTSAFFLYAFIPVFFILYSLAPLRGRNLVLLSGSLIFYFAGAGQVVVVLLVSIILNHYLARRLSKPEYPHRELLLTAGIAINLAGLFYYKYTVFAWGLVQQLTGIPSVAAPAIALPIGISFFTFQAISYIVDVYRGSFPPARNYVDFAVYHSLFPQLVAGPIVRYGEVWRELHNRVYDLPRITEGVYRCCLGFGKKIVLADNMGAVADKIIGLPSQQLTTEHAWLGILCYTLQIYYDFSGYSDMAIGLGKLLGFDFPENFNQPYRSASITEFWGRWHMTLSRWFRDYVYIPAGGNRCGPFRTYFNLCLVFVLCGLWHGAGLNFLVWGLYHGVLLIVERIAHRHLGYQPSGPFATAVTFVLVMVGWVFFRIENFGASLSFLHTMFVPTSAGTIDYPLSYFLKGDTISYLLVGIFFAMAPLEKIASLRTERMAVFGAQLGFAVVSFGLAAIQLAANSFNPFIYFRF